jgi:hypothetical protein
MHLRQAAAKAAYQPVVDDPRDWRIPALDYLPQLLDALPGATRKVLFFAPYNHVIQPEAGAGRALWEECKSRAARIAGSARNAVVADFMIPSPITRDDNNYWDELHYRVGIADRIARDLAAASRGEAGEDYVLLQGEAERVSAAAR